MDVLAKFGELAEAMQYEPAEEVGASAPVGLHSGAAAAAGCGISRKLQDAPIHQAVMPGGKRIALLKTLLTSACERDCYYCVFRSGRDGRRTTFTPDEMAQGFMALYRDNAAQGLFLSSGVAGGGVRTQDRLIAAAEILRHKMGFRGYLHLKLMPGAERDQVERAMQLADRVSLNLEAPNTQRLSQLAPHKTFIEELLRPLQWVEQIRREKPGAYGWNNRWPSTTTQFVVGGARETDLELLTTTAYLNREIGLARAYFSAFKPVQNTPLENEAPADPWRQHRLYQASFLLRDYGFDLEELPFEGSGNLSLTTDPKLAWARENLEAAPVEVNLADRLALMRVPGIGPKTAQAILSARRVGRLRDIKDLKALGVRVEQARQFILLDGWQPPRQLALF